MSYNLFLDDYRVPSDCVSYMHRRIGKDNPIYVNEEWVIAHNYEEFVGVIKKRGLPRMISFDHDLADEHYSSGFRTVEDWEEYEQLEQREMTGYDCAKWLVEYCMENKKLLPRFFVHSMNPTGTMNIENYLNNFLKNEKV